MTTWRNTTRSIGSNLHGSRSVSCSSKVATVAPPVQAQHVVEAHDSDVDDQFSGEEKWKQVRRHHTPIDKSQQMICL